MLKLPVGRQTDNPYIYYDANNVRKARINQLLRDCLPAGRELPYVQLEEEVGRRIGNKLWAYNILKAVIRNGNLVCRKDENGLELLSLPCV